MVARCGIAACMQGCTCHHVARHLQPLAGCPTHGVGGGIFRYDTINTKGYEVYRYPHGKTHPLEGEWYITEKIGEQENLIAFVGTHEQATRLREALILYDSQPAAYELLRAASARKEQPQ